jgi:hypothetical protein
MEGPEKIRKWLKDVVRPGGSAAPGTATEEAKEESEFKIQDF